MPKYGFSPDICKTISDADCGNGTPSRGAIDALVERLTNSSGANPNNEEVKRFIQATTDMFASTWYATVIGIINKIGIKTRIGMATIIRAVGWTGGQSSLINNPFVGPSKGICAAAPYNREEIIANVPLGDENKEAKFVKLWWESHLKRGTERRCVG